jgi:hypothetical protein
MAFLMVKEFVLCAAETKVLLTFTIKVKRQSVDTHNNIDNQLDATITVY